jgi:hypothetical protein
MQLQGGSQKWGGNFYKWGHLSQNWGAGSDKWEGRSQNKGANFDKWGGTRMFSYNEFFSHLFSFGSIFESGCLFSFLI